MVTYQHRQALLAINLDDNLTADEKNAAINNANQMLLLSGNLPDLPSSLSLIEQWQQDTELFTETLTQYHVANIKTVELNLPCQVTHQAQLFNINLTVELPVVDQHLIHYRSSSAKPKDILMMAGYQLALQHLANTQLAKLSLVEQGIAGNVNKTLGIYFDTKAQKVSTIEMSAFEQPQQLLSLLLSTYLTGQQQALLVNASLGEKLVSSLNKNLPFEQTSFEQFWLDPNSASSLGDDPYMQFFWPETPNIELHQDLLAAIYLAIFTGAKKLK